MKIKVSELRKIIQEEIDKLKEEETVVDDSKLEEAQINDMYLVKMRDSFLKLKEQVSVLERYFSKIKR